MSTQRSNIRYEEEEKKKKRNQSCIHTKKKRTNAGVLVKQLRKPALSNIPSYRQIEARTSHSCKLRAHRLQQPLHTRRPGRGRLLVLEADLYHAHQHADNEGDEEDQHGAEDGGQDAEFLLPPPPRLGDGAQARGAAAVGGHAARHALHVRPRPAAVLGVVVVRWDGRGVGDVGCGRCWCWCWCRVCVGACASCAAVVAAEEGAL
ncbi:hypothetical protein CTRI78_v006069 [Colletotrichum trifolii]|uniref:Uncharacterized protein n=1 Tax=Colletotrichum trifolii TaxID=5466 RepID=A0A4R8RD89_COLTR|nr:hypothetical protein CTRI78_v006069 [Colletotrichum trifolii]